MLKKIFIFFLPFFVSSEKSCYDSDNVNYFYKELGCTPVFENDSKCPTSYDCKNFFQRSKNQCRYHDVSYPIGSKLTTRDVLKGCGAQECRCIEGSDNNPTFNCANSECFTRWENNCTTEYVQLFEEGQCCSQTFHCKGVDPKLPECTYGGKTYVEGQAIYPDDEPCKKCHCRKGSQVVCEDISCGVELHSSSNLNENCVPVFYNTGCCPIYWRCPNDKFKVKSTEERQEPVTSRKCKFGDAELNQFDILEFEFEPNLRCSCSVPPFVTCTHV